VTKSNSIPILTFFGSRGGGLQLLRSLTSELDKGNIDYQVWMSRRAFESEKWFLDPGASKFVVLDIPNSFKTLITPKYWRGFVKTLWTLFFLTKKLPILEVVQVMPSPFDFIIDLLSKRRKLDNIRFIHDFQNHPGDFWPRKRSIKMRVKRATVVVCFSNYVAESLRLRYHSSPVVLSLPSSHFSHYENLVVSSGVRNVIESRPSKPRLLMIGRMRDYKGTRLLAEALDLVETDYELIVAGEGDKAIELSRLGLVLNQWLSEFEFISLIRNSDIVIFPYIEATQSGTIPICISENKLIVVTDVGGLVTQCNNYAGCFVAYPNSRNSLANKIDEAIKILLSNNQRKPRPKIIQPDRQEVTNWLRIRYKTREVDDEGVLSIN
jgi:glycosyltransferase involved in cell wall biosynthesis